MRRTARTAALLSAAAVALTVVTPAYAAPPAGLYGAQDPTYDGAYRQGLALLALGAVGEDDALGTAWLVDQQCPDGGWVAYRASTDSPCPATDPATFAGEDSNSTALALLGLAAHGVAPEHDPLPFLKSLQNADGGFGYLDGQPTDANSTALVIQALLALGEDPTAAAWDAASGDPMSALLALQLGCAADEEDRGAWEYQPGQGANALATVQTVPAAALAVYPMGPVATVAPDEPTVDCTGAPVGPPAVGDPDTAADLGAGWLARQVNAQGFIPGPGGPNYTLTASAVLAFAAAGVGGDAYDAALAYLADHVDAAVRDGDGVDQPGPLALLILAARTAGLDPTDFGGTDLVARLRATQRQQAASEEPTPEPPVSVDPDNTAGGGEPVAEPLPDVVPTLVETGGFGQKPWDEVGVAVFGAGLIGYGLLALAGAHLLSRRRTPRHL